MGDREGAMRKFRAALAMADESRNPQWRANHLSALADCYDDEGEWEIALEQLDLAIEVRRETGDLGGIASNLRLRANILLGLERIEDALVVGEAALEQAKELGMRLGSFQVQLAEVLLAADRHGDAAPLLELSVAGVTRGSWKDNRLLGIASLRDGDAKAARVRFKRSLEHAESRLEKSTNASAEAAVGLALCGLACCDGGDLPRAVKLLSDLRDSAPGRGLLATWRRQAAWLAPFATLEAANQMRQALSERLH